MSSAIRPTYEVIQKEEHYEIRKYAQAKWVTTEVKNISHKAATEVAFQRLFEYIQGNNEEKQKVNMTAPVTVLVLPGAGPNCESTFVEAFYIPPDLQANPPTPSSPDLYIESRPELTVFVGSFGGFADDEKFVTHAKELTEAIGDESKFHSDFYYTVSYDGPHTQTGRVNEIWFVKK